MSIPIQRKKEILKGCGLREGFNFSISIFAINLSFQVSLQNCFWMKFHFKRKHQDAIFWPQSWVGNTAIAIERLNFVVHSNLSIKAAILT